MKCTMAGLWAGLFLLTKKLQCGILKVENITSVMFSTEL